GELLDRDLPRIRNGRVWQSAVAHDRISRDAHLTRRGDDPTAPIAKPIPVCRDWHRRADDNVVWRRKVRDTREMYVEHQNRRRRLGKRVLQFVPNPYFHLAL